LGALFCAGAVVWLVSGLVNTDYPAFIAARQLVATVPVAIVLHALLAFPSGRLTTRPARTLTALGYLVTAVVLPLRCCASSSARRPASLSSPSESTSGGPPCASGAVRGVLISGDGWPPPLAPRHRRDRPNLGEISAYATRRNAKDLRLRRA
jgi:hypothetical protein